MEEIILYSTKCPQCKVLESKIKSAGLNYAEVNDISIMKEKGFMSAPMLEADGKIMNFKEAFNYITSLQEVHIER